MTAKARRKSFRVALFAKLFFSSNASSPYIRLTCFFFNEGELSDDPAVQISQIIAHSNRLGEYIWRKIVSTRENAHFRFYRRKTVKNRKYTKNSRKTPHSTQNDRLSDENIRNFTQKMPTSGFIVGKPIRPEVPLNT